MRKEYEPELTTIIVSRLVEPGHWGIFLRRIADRRYAYEELEKEVQEFIRIGVQNQNRFERARYFDLKKYSFYLSARENMRYALNIVAESVIPEYKMIVKLSEGHPKVAKQFADNCGVEFRAVMHSDGRKKKRHCEDSVFRAVDFSRSTCARN